MIVRESLTALKHLKADLASIQLPKPLDQMAFLISPVIQLITNNAVFTGLLLSLLTVLSGCLWNVVNTMILIRYMRDQCCQA